jgi:cytidylate kinase
MKRFVITIGRTCGSGGSTVAKLVAKKLGVSYYDKSVLSLHSDDGFISEALFETNTEEEETLLKRVSADVFRDLEDKSPIPPESYDFTVNERLFDYQSKVLTALAAEESYVVVGRGADHVLKNVPDVCVFNVFITAPTDVCTYKEAGRLCMSSKAAAAHVYKFNHYRDEYYRYFTGHERTDLNNYELCLNTHYLNYEACADIIIKALEHFMA